MKTAMTIGFFDGVHIGHQALLRRLREFPHATILTFTSHPQSVLRPPAPPLLIPYELKIALLKPFADTVVIRDFTKEFASIPYDHLLDQFDISHLILGKGASFGESRKGREANVREYASKRGIEVEYCPKILFDGEPVSSSRIRKAVSEQNIPLAQQLLGRPL